ncbi:hypothetical protein GGH92_005600 [Coemansia sp. RSA 2673]|nr:hypothetical protein GGH92_005600 [Coemansia sp. RSA 2673]
MLQSRQDQRTLVGHLGLDATPVADGDEEHEQQTRRPILKKSLYSSPVWARVVVLD